MINEESRVMLLPHTISRVNRDILMVARNWFDFFDVQALEQVKKELESGQKEVKLSTLPVTTTPQVPQEVYICRLVDGYFVMDSTRTPRTVQVLAHKVWELL